MENSVNRSAAFSFLDSQLEKEAHIYDILKEILRKQEAFLITKEGTLATLAELLESRNIKIPHSPTRNKNIIYLTETLCKKHPERVRAIPSFSFTADKEAKKLSIDETIEYTVNMDDDLFMEIMNQRNSQSKKNILDLLAMFRSTNLTKLLRNSMSKTYLLDLLREEEGKNLFFYKQYTFDNHMNELAEDYCFHKKNFDQIKRGLTMTEIQKIITHHSAAVIRKMKSFGIMNINISDYSDTKLDYLLKAVLDELSPNIDKKDILTVKNFSSLRDSLMNVSRVMDPLVSLSMEIASYIRKNGICKDSELAAVFPPLTAGELAKWAPDDLEKKKIMTYQDPEGLFFIDSQILSQRLEDLQKTIIGKPEIFNAMTEADKKKTLGLADLLCNAAAGLFAGKNTFSYINETSAQKLSIILKDFEKYKTSKRAAAIEPRETHENKSIIKKIISFFSSFFGGKAANKRKQSSAHAAGKAKKPLSAITKDIFSQIKERNSPLIPLSDYIALKKENDNQINTVIEEIQQHELKIVVPIYNARTVLYPARSQGYIVSDVEYMMVDPLIILTAESIRNFTDSLNGYTIKDEKIPGKAILVIENYLLTLYRQNKAKKRRKS
jgi:hypothetical protein